MSPPAATLVEVVTLSKISQVTMKFFSFAFLFTLLIVGSLGIPIKNNEEEVKKLLKEKEKIVNEDLDAFLNATESGTVSEIRDYLKTLVKTQKRAHDNLIRILPKLEKIIGALDSLSKDRLEGTVANTVLRMLQRSVLKMLTTLVDGNRDNVSYYMYDAAQEWIHERTKKGTYGPGVAKLKNKLNEAQAMIIKARDTLDDNAQIFVKTIKEVKKMRENSSEWKKIQEQIAELVRATKSTDMRKISQEALDKVIEIQKQPGDVPE